MLDQAVENLRGCQALVSEDRDGNVAQGERFLTYLPVDIA